MSDDEAEAVVPETRPGQRIAKVMARAGVCSRRDAEAWITAGRVSVNGAVLASPAFNVTEADDVRVDGNPLPGPERTRLFLFHKPRGLVTTARDPEGRSTVFDALPPGLPRVVAVGRLDINTEGLILLTNDGGLARVLELPATGWLRRYRVRAHGAIDQAALDRLAGGVTIDGIDYQSVEARLDREQGANAWLTLGLREGKNREIKKILEHLGLAVNRLIRVSFGPFELGDLPEGEVMEVRTRVLSDQLGAKLARQAGANFDAPLIIREASAPEPGPGGRSDHGRRDNRAMHGRSDRGAGRAERDGAPRRGRPQPSTPERRRKHVSALRAEIAADASDSKAPRTRVVRGATQDRKGRTVTVERRSRADDAESGRFGREKPERGRRPTPFGSKAARDGKGRERSPAPHRSGTASRGAFNPDGERDGRPQRRMPDDWKHERSGRSHAARRFKPREDSARGSGGGRRDERNGPRAQGERVEADFSRKSARNRKNPRPLRINGIEAGSRPGGDRGARAPGPARGKGPPRGSPRGKGGSPRRPPRKP